MLSRAKENKTKKQRQSNANFETQLSKARNLTKSKVRQSSKSISKKKKCGDNCKKHDFELKPVGYSCFLSKGITQPITINFCSKGNSLTIPIPIIPQQLKNQPQVPLFILNQEVRRYQHYIDSHRQQFQDAIKKAEKAVDSDGEEEDLIKAIPKTKNCQVCRLKIDTQEQYERHTLSLDHKIAIKRSMGQKYILEETQALEAQKSLYQKQNKFMNQLIEVGNIMKNTKKILKGLLERK